MLISNSAFLVGQIPYYHAISQHYDRISYWGDQKRKCIEGCWVAGKWMPGTLYYYVNFHKIKFEDEEGNSKAIGLPWLRDIEWEKAYMYEEACGFSGFEFDIEYTCDRKYGPEQETALKYGRITQEEIDSKIYINAREYLVKNHGQCLGKALYRNNAKNVIDLEARGGGKSYWASGLIAHNFLFDGATDYDRYLARKKAGNPMTSETLVGAIDGKFSGDLLDKVKVALEHLPDQQEYSNGNQIDIYPSPLSVEYSGSLMTGKKYTNTNKSLLHHRTFNDDPLAANGTRPNRAFLEEVGFMSNIIEAWAAIEATQASSQFKNLVIYGLGTGGLTTAGAALHCQEIYYNPELYNCVAFEDIYENRGQIGYFLPAYMTLNEFKKGPNLITDIPLAKTYVEDKIEAARKSGNSKTLQATIINSPLVPSEIFMTMNDNFFPTIDLKECLAELETNNKLLDSSYKAEFTINSQGQAKWVFSKKYPIRNFPLRKGDVTDSCVEIFEQPKRDGNGDIVYGRYIAGTDPVDDDGGDARNSLQCTWVMDSWTGKLVAEYTARTQFAENYYETARRLLMYYNAQDNYEQNKKGFYAHFKNKNSLYLLAETPEILRDQEMTKIAKIGNKKFGTNANDKINLYGRQLILKWLSEQAYGEEEGVLNMHMIRSVALLKELINWSPQINADRISALGMLMILKADKALYLNRTDMKQPKSLSQDNFFNLHIPESKRKSSGAQEMFPYG